MTTNNSNVLKEIRKALGDPFELKDSEIDSFLSRYDAGEINTPPMPSHLLPDLISHNIGRGINPIHSISDIPNDSLNDLAMAARNGDEILSEETLQKMLKAQEE